MPGSLNALVARVRFDKPTLVCFRAVEDTDGVRVIVSALWQGVLLYPRCSQLPALGTLRQSFRCNRYQSFRCNWLRRVVRIGCGPARQRYSPNDKGHSHEAALFLDPECSLYG